MSATWLKGSGVLEAQAIASFRPQTFSSINFSTTVLALFVLYVLFQRSSTKRVSGDLGFTQAKLTVSLQTETLFEQRHGCGAPRRLPYKWPLALDIVFDAFRIIGEKQALQYFVDIFERIGPTFEQHILGAKGIDTVEPENLESVLSTNFASK